MGRHRIYTNRLSHGFAGGPRWRDPYHCEWAIVVGDRIRRLRNDRRLTLAQLCGLVYKPEGGHYSAGYLSRIERGWASAPLYVYLAIADVLEVQPGRLLGPDDATRPVSEGELTLVRFARRLDLSPDEAIAMLAKARSGDEGAASGDERTALGGDHA
jgi:transcriptional regulator with XRE-family HTH domain